MWAARTLVRILLSCIVANGFHHVRSKREKTKRYVSPNRDDDLTLEHFRLCDDSHSSLQSVVFASGLPQKNTRCWAELNPQRKRSYNSSGEDVQTKSGPKAEGFRSITDKCITDGFIFCHIWHLQNSQIIIVGTLSSICCHWRETSSLMGHRTEKKEHCRCLTSYSKNNPELQFNNKHSRIPSGPKHTTLPAEGRKTFWGQSNAFVLFFFFFLDNKHQ